MELVSRSPDLLESVYQYRQLERDCDGEQHGEEKVARPHRVMWILYDLRLRSSRSSSGANASSIKPPSMEAAVFPDTAVPVTIARYKATHAGHLGRSAAARAGSAPAMSDVPRFTRRSFRARSSRWQPQRAGVAGICRDDAPRPSETADLPHGGRAE